MSGKVGSEPMILCRHCEVEIEQTGQGYWVDAEMYLPYCRKLANLKEVPLFHEPLVAGPQVSG
jgi:hypothetical protein